MWLTEFLFRKSSVSGGCTVPLCLASPSGPHSEDYCLSSSLATGLQWNLVAYTGLQSASDQGHPSQTAGAQTQSLCISSAEDIPKAGISIRAWTGERNKSFTDYFLLEIHNIVGHQNSCFLPFAGRLEIYQNLQIMFATFGETREKQVILVSISSTEHGKGQKI